MQRGRILVIVENNSSGGVSESSLELISEAGRVANALPAEVIALGFGHESNSSEFTGLGEYGVARFVLLPAPSSVPGVLASYVLSVLEAYDALAVLGSGTLWGQDLFACLASGLEAPLFSNCVQLAAEEGSLCVTRYTLNDKVAVKYAALGGKTLLATVRPGLFNVKKAYRGKRAELAVANAGSPVEATVSFILGTMKASPRTMQPEDAEVIVCGGRGMGSRGNFELLWELAELLGATVGGTRVARDNGWVPAERQIGQTGKIVSPELLISCGVSGATQHTIGLKDSKQIVAINTDKNAPIMKLADVAIVGDAVEVVRQLIAKIRAGRQRATGGRRSA